MHRPAKSFRIPGRVSARPGPTLHLGGGMQHSILRTLAAAAILGALVGAPAEARAQQGAVVGRVTDKTSEQPIAGAQVVVTGTSRGALTGADGRYRIGALPAGEHQLRVISIGYESLVHAVTVEASGTATVDFALSATAVSLDELVVTATGEQERKRQMGSGVSTIQLDEGPPPAAPDLSQVINARAPGVSITETSGTTGADAPRIRIRGASSLSLDNNPLLIVDGIRLDNNATNTAGTGSLSIGLGGQITNRLNDIDPADIETIEILKGPAAAALYGTAAANGVIQITTKRGAAGPSHWTFTAEGGANSDKGNWPTNYQGLDANGKGCTLNSVAQGRCVQASVAQYNPLVAQSPFRTGAVEKYGMTVSGGSDAVTYYVAGNWSRDDGVYAINSDRSTHVRANVQAQVRPNLRFFASSAYINSAVSLPQNDNNVLGILPQGLLGGAFPDSAHNFGWFGIPPKTLFNLVTDQSVNRMIGAASADWQPLQWLTVNGIVGLDNENRFDSQTVQPNTIAFGSLPDGQRTSNRFEVNNYSFDTNATATFHPRSDLTSTTSVGTQYEKNRLQSTDAFGAVLLAGTNSLAGTSARFAVNEDYSDLVTIGAYGQQQVGWRDRVFLTGALRLDDNSAFGKSFGLAKYPSVSGSWVISEEPFFPKGKLLDNLRLRASLGTSGLQPQFRFNENFFTPVAITQQTGEVGGITIGGNGLSNLKPERSTEFETGFEASTLGRRVGLDLTFYDKVSHDALIATVLAPSIGQSTQLFENIGQLSNRGFELQVTAQPIRTRPATLDLVLSGSTNRNRIESMGGQPPIIFGADNTQRHVQGYPAGGYWGLPIKSYGDLNHDGIISRVNCPGGPQVSGGPACEVTLGSSPVFLGSSIPTRLASLSSTLTFYRNLSLTALLDYKGGYRQYNDTESFRCAFANDAAANVKGSNLADQAACSARSLGSFAGFIEDGSFIKLREVSATYRVPERLTRRVSASNVAFTVAGRELATLWTPYRGIDPEVNEAAGNNFSLTDFLTQPLVRRWTASVSVGF